MADIRKLAGNLSVAPQLTTTDIAEIEALGFKSVLCNRPDAEEVSQPEYQQIKTSIEDRGLQAAFQPVNGSTITDEDVDQFAAHLESLSQPVLAYCRSGTRCTVLWALSEAGKRPIDEILAIATAAGYALEPLRPRLEERAAKR